MKNRAVIVIQSSGKYVYDFADNGKGKQIPLFGEDILKAKIYDISSNDTELMEDIKNVICSTGELCGAKLLGGN